MSNHTPRPWIFDNEIGRIYTDTIPYEEWAVANVNIVRAEAKANARLIAAAPDLLEALKLVVTIASEAHDHWDNDNNVKVGKILIALSGHLPRYDKRIDEMHAAIAKATGEQA